MSTNKLLQIAISSAFAITLAGGCHYYSDKFGGEKMIPSPLPDSFPYELQGSIYKIMIGNEIQIKSEKNTSYILLQGVNNPDTGDEREGKAIDQLYALIDDSDLKVVVHARDHMERAIGQVFVGDKNINLEMIRSGWGQYDGTDFELAESFEQAQQQAQDARLGIWAKQ